MKTRHLWFGSFGLMAALVVLTLRSDVFRLRKGMITREVVKAGTYSTASCSLPEGLPQYDASSNTMRPLTEYRLYQPGFFSLLDFIDSIPGGDVMEIGCGSGRALLDIKAKYPNMNAFGTNYNGYGYSQTNGSVAHLWTIARHFNTSVACSADGEPAFPIIYETVGIQDPNYASIFHGRKFDFILSRHALNQGKLAPKDSGLIIPRISSMLEEDGVAMIHLLFGAFDNISKHEKYPVLYIANIGPPSAAYSIILYHTRCYRENCIAMLMKRCPQNAPRHEVHGDCIIPNSLQLELPPTGWMLSEMERAAQQAPKERKAWLKYPFDYMTHWVKAMEQWERSGRIFVPPDRQN